MHIGDGTGLNLSEIAKHYSDEEAAWLFFERTRWPSGPVCPHCGAIDHACYIAPKSGARTTRTGKVTYRRLWFCGECRTQFSVLVGTIFEDSKVPLSKWLLAYHMLCSGKNGVAALEISRVLGVCYKTAWFMMHRIRHAMAPALAAQQDGEQTQPAQPKLSGVVEADETYIGGRAHGKRGRGALNKTPVVTLVERDGEARSRVVTNVTGANIKEVLTGQVEPDAVLMTDSYQVYTEPGREFAEHHTVDHGAKEYAKTVTGKDGTERRAHVNTAEGYFSQLKRSVDGTYHHVSERHLPRYLAEFDYRYNTRKVKDGERTVTAIRQAAGKRLMYEKSLIGQLAHG